MDFVIYRPMYIFFFNKQDVFLIIILVLFTDKGSPFTPSFRSYFGILHMRNALCACAEYQNKTGNQE